MKKEVLEMLSKKITVNGNFLKFMYLNALLTLNIMAPLYQGEGVPGEYGDNRAEDFRKALTAVTALSLGQYNVHYDYFSSSQDQGDNQDQATHRDSNWINGLKKDWLDNKKDYVFDLQIRYWQRSAFFSDSSILKQYMGLQFGRIFFIREVKNEYSFNQERFTMEDGKNGDTMTVKSENYIFSQPRKNSSRFFASDGDFSVDQEQILPDQITGDVQDPIAVITTNSADSNFYYSSIKGVLYKCSIDPATKSIKIEQLNKEKISYNQTVQFGFHALKNKEAQQSWEERNELMSWLYNKNGDGQKAADFSVLWYPRTNRNRHAVTILTPIREEHFKQKEILIPISFENKLCVINAIANVLSLNPDTGLIIPKKNTWQNVSTRWVDQVDPVNIEQKVRRMAAWQVANGELHGNPITDGVKNAIRSDTLPTEDGLLQPKAACQDLAIHKKFIAGIFVGRFEPSFKGEQLAGNSKIQRVSSPTIDPYNGDNYFFYLKVSPNTDLSTENFFLNADRGMEGQYTDIVNQFVLMTDMMLDEKDGFLKFVDFDKNGNLFILTSNGSIYGYSATSLDKEMTGPFKAVKFSTTGVDSPSFMSCGDGIVIKSKDGSLFFISNEDVQNGFLPQKNKTIPWKAFSNKLKAKTFALADDGMLIVYSGDSDKKIYAFSKENYAATPASIIKDVKDSMMQLAMLCHPVLKDKTKKYFGLTVPSIIYPQIDSAQSAIELLTEMSNVVGKITKAAWKKNQEATDVIQLFFNKLRTQFPDSDPENTSFIQNLNALEQTIFSANPYYRQSRSLRTRLQSLNNILNQDTNFDPQAPNLELLVKKTKELLNSVKASIDEIIADKTITLEATPFQGLDELLSAQTEQTGETGQVGSSLVLEWLNTNKAKLINNALMDPMITEETFLKWQTELKAIEKNVYLKSDTVLPETSLAALKAAIEFVATLKSQDELAKKDKSNLIEHLKEVVKYKNYFTTQEFSTIKEDLLFLQNKFKLDKDSTISSSFKNLIDQLTIDFNVLYFVDQCKGKIPSLTATNIPDFLNSLKNIVELKADFDALGKTALSEKDNFINFLLKQLEENTILKTYQESIKDKAESEDIKKIIFELKEFATAKDIISSLKEIAKNSDLTATQLKLSQTLLELCRENGWAQKKLSLTDMRIASSVANKLFNLSKSIPKITINNDKYNFETFLSNRVSEIQANQDSTSKLWSTNAVNTPFFSKFSLNNFWQIVKNYQDFNPNLNSNENKYQLLAICKYINISASNHLTIISEDAPERFVLNRIVNETQKTLELLDPFFKTKTKTSGS